MNVAYPVKKELKVAWGGITLPLKAGTPMSADGEIKNTASAIGLVADTHTFIDGATIEIFVGGSVSTAEANESFGGTLTKAAKQAMDGINFLDSNGNPESKYTYTLPAATETVLGGVKMAGNVIAGDDDSDALKAVLVALKAAGIMAADPAPES